MQSKIGSCAGADPGAATDVLVHGLARLVHGRHELLRQAGHCVLHAGEDHHAALALRGHRGGGHAYRHARPALIISLSTRTRPVSLYLTI